MLNISQKKPMPIADVVQLLQALPPGFQCVRHKIEFEPMVMHVTGIESSPRVPSSPTRVVLEMELGSQQA